MEPNTGPIPEFPSTYLVHVNLRSRSVHAVKFPGPSIWTQSQAHPVNPGPRPNPADIDIRLVAMYPSIKLAHSLTKAPDLPTQRPQQQTCLQTAPDGPPRNSGWVGW